RSSMSGISNVGDHSRALFDRLIGENSKALVLKDGEIKSSGSMALRSGVHRMIGGDKIQEDREDNKKTMQFLLDHVSNHVTEDEMEKIMNSKIKLGSEKEGHTVAQRLERGTYISSELVGQLR